MSSAYCSGHPIGDQRQRSFVTRYRDLPPGSPEHDDIRSRYTGAVRACPALPEERFRDDLSRSVIGAVGGRATNPHSPCRLGAARNQAGWAVRRAQSTQFWFPGMPGLIAALWGSAVRARTARLGGMWPGRARPG